MKSKTLFTIGATLGFVCAIVALVAPLLPNNDDFLLIVGWNGIVLAILLILLSSGFKRIEINSASLKFNKKFKDFLKKEYYVVKAKPEVRGKLSFLDEVYGQDMGRSFVIAYIDIDKADPESSGFTDEEIFISLTSSLKADFKKVWSKVSILSKSTDQVTHLKRGEKEMTRYQVSIEVPEGVRPPANPPFNGFNHMFIRTIQEVVPITRI